MINEVLPPLSGDEGGNTTMVGIMIVVIKKKLVGQMA